MFDPGHGGDANPGVVQGSLVEADIVLDIALKAASLAYGLPIFTGVGLTRNTDEKLTLDQRGEISAGFGADYVISIHVNAPPPGAKSQGALVFYWPGNTNGRLLALRIYDMLPVKLQRNPPRAHAATKAEWPRVRNCLAPHKATSVLLECGFATHKPDRELLLSEPGRFAIAAALVIGMRKFLEDLEVKP